MVNGLTDEGRILDIHARGVAAVEDD